MALASSTVSSTDLITAAQAHLTAFGPWLERELSAAEGEIKSFFDKFRTATPQPVPGSVTIIPAPE